MCIVEAIRGAHRTQGSSTIINQEPHGSQAGGLHAPGSTGSCIHGASTTPSQRVLIAARAENARRSGVLGRK